MGERDSGEENIRKSVYFVNCPTDGKQFVPESDLQIWSREIAELLDLKSFITANCPICHTTLQVSKRKAPKSYLIEKWY